MERPKIMNQEILRYQIQLLEAQEKQYRALLIRDAGELIDTVKDPVPMIKRTVKSLAADGDFRSDLLKIGLNFAGSYLQNKFAGGSAVKDLIAKLLDKFRNAGTGK